MPTDPSRLNVESAAWAWLFRAHGRVARALEQALRPLGLTPAQVRALTVLHEAAGAPPTMAALAQAIALAPQAVTTLVDGLEARGWVRRVPDARDRRVIRIELLPAGAATLAEAQRRVDTVLTTILGNLSLAELQDLMRLLDRVGDV